MKTRKTFLVKNGGLNQSIIYNEASLIKYYFVMNKILSKFLLKSKIMPSTKKDNYKEYWNRIESCIDRLIIREFWFGNHEILYRRWITSIKTVYAVSDTTQMKQCERRWEGESVECVQVWMRYCTKCSNVCFTLLSVHNFLNLIYSLFLILLYIKLLSLSLGRKFVIKNKWTYKHVESRVN